jgi:hypothetical protein
MDPIGKQWKLEEIGLEQSMVVHTCVPSSLELLVQDNPWLHNGLSLSVCICVWGGDKSKKKKKR